MKYASILMRNDDDFMKKKRQQYEKQVGLEEKRNTVFNRL